MSKFEKHAKKIRETNNFSSDDVDAVTNGAKKRQTGSHCIATSENGQHVVYPRPKDHYGPGLAKAIRLALIGAGFIMFVFAFIIPNVA